MIVRTSWDLVEGAIHHSRCQRHHSRHGWRNDLRVNDSDWDSKQRAVLHVLRVETLNLICHRSRWNSFTVDVCNEARPGSVEHRVGRHTNHHSSGRLVTACVGRLDHSQQNRNFKINYGYHGRRKKCL